MANNGRFYHKMIPAKSVFKHKDLQYFKEHLSYFSQKQKTFDKCIDRRV